MYRMLIADDEIDKLESLRENYDWAKYNVTICGEARDGESAYAFLVKEHPDICIMDVKMPLMSGLEAIKRARAVGVATKCIILSGYDDFQYAQEAIRLSSVEYLLKPCRFNDIIEAVLKCIQIIDKENADSAIADQYTQFSKIDKIYKKEQLLRGMIKSKANKTDIIKEKLKQNHLLFTPDCYAISVIAFDEAELSVSNDNDLIFDRITGYADEAFDKSALAESVVYNNRFVFVTSMENIGESFDRFLQTLHGLSDFIRSRFFLDHAIGVSDIKNDIGDFSGAYAEAETTANAALFFLEKKVIFYAEIGNYKFEYPQLLEEKVLLSLSAGEDEMIQSVNDFFSCFRFKSYDSKQDVQNMAIMLIYNIMRHVSKGHDDTNLSQNTSRSVQQVLNCTNLQNITDTLIQYIRSLSVVPAKKSVSVFVEMAIAAIKERYCEKISLESVAESIHISPSYLSMLFKQHTNVNMTEYLNRYRIEKSKEYLKDYTLKGFEIAYKVGFQDEKYYYQLFKRYTGVTPSQYREELFRCTEQSGSKK